MSGVMKPKPLSWAKNFTVPVAILSSLVLSVLNAIPVNALYGKDLHGEQILRFGRLCAKVFVYHLNQLPK
ncbi:hypothetical protein EMEDMD4_910050 [Sinorhizobium medicae]|uniref:Uncharacterized protein n=1 Tax=Sinorhizobium medicae TaxID=110321 RepID=A0A508X7T8_9HYPH|nr:hypothetical protein EMEDMD4_910050 [Sinorhizobium medicae]